MGWVALQHVGSPWIRYRTRVSCSGRWILYHQVTRAALPSSKWKIVTGIESSNQVKFNHSFLWRTNHKVTREQLWYTFSFFAKKGKQLFLINSRLLLTVIILTVKDYLIQRVWPLGKDECFFQVVPLYAISWPCTEDCSVALCGLEWGPPVIQTETVSPTLISSETRSRGSLPSRLLTV